jgi:hypothetical protein
MVARTRLNVTLYAHCLSCILVCGANWLRKWEGVFIPITLTIPCVVSLHTGRLLFPFCIDFRSPSTVPKNSVLNLQGLILRLIVFVVGNYICQVTDRAGGGEKLYRVVPTDKSKYFFFEMSHPRCVDKLYNQKDILTLNPLMWKI